MELLLLVSLFAAFLALHNVATRYLFALGRARLLPSVLGRTAATGRRCVASAVQVAFNVIVVGALRHQRRRPAPRHHREHDRLRDARDRRAAGRGGVLGRRLLPPPPRPAASGARSSRRRSAAPACSPRSSSRSSNFRTLAGSDADIIGLLPWLHPHRASSLGFAVARVAASGSEPGRSTPPWAPRAGGAGVASPSPSPIRWTP